MDNNRPDDPEEKIREVAWAPKVKQVQVSAAPPGAINLNVHGRQLVSPLQGFGQLWQKTFRVRLSGVKLSPVEVMEIWKANFPKFQPPENHFYPSLAGVKPGEVFFIDARVPAFPGTPSILPVATGVMVLYVDEVSFTVMNPEGHPLSGWNTFSVSEDNGTVVAQVQEQSRASDPLYEFFNRFLGSSAQQDKIWFYVLSKLAEHFGVTGQVTLAKTLIDPRVQWSEAGAIWKNAAIRTVFYALGWPIRQIFKPRNR
jgi:hypothetical protein